MIDEAQLCLILGPCLSLPASPIKRAHLLTGLQGLVQAVTHPAFLPSLAARWSVGWQLSKASTWTSATDCWPCVLQTETSSLPSLPVGDHWGSTGTVATWEGKQTVTQGCSPLSAGAWVCRCAVSLQEQQLIRQASEPMGRTCSLSQEVFLRSGTLQDQQEIQGTPHPNNRLKGAICCLISSPQ